VWLLTCHLKALQNIQPQRQDVGASKTGATRASLVRS
jgi:hypothetical protein